ncbi:hypothetical protein NBRC110019_14030 [Neptunitalea chrysea]|uniref:Peptidoglycan-binding protein LysM n=1 Tax=Neptunitalea chrysea TaxID=1647581 RepID=A0A9W6B7V2_9FLAO|nr:peptidoglycan-binding protein LysM [Neptunitalea chrysea]GLB52363.1 hypothetical protein NBRC110019_14030 [Neptunitalea chrysea]
MKKNAVKIVLSLLCLGFIYFGYSKNKTKTEYKKPLEKEKIKKTIPDSLIAKFSITEPSFKTISKAELITPPFTGKSFTGFKEALGYKESRGNYFVTNQLGYLGKYQFGKKTLRAFGIHDTKKFLNDPELQEKVLIAYMARNKAILRKEIKKYVGKRINGVYVTESGILAAAHLGGAGNVKKFLRTSGSHVFRDANGTSIKFYMKKFAGYDLSFIKADRKAKVI